ncbi:MAG: hypothetical protein R2831_03550 [Chitinophagaceae bacterium]
MKKAFICFLLLANKAWAQDHLMAKDNMQFSFHTTFIAHCKKLIQKSFDNYLVTLSKLLVKDSLSLNNHISRFYYVTADYAYSDYTTFGIQIGYRRVNLQQINRTSSAPLQDDYYNNYYLSIKGSNFLFDLKATRYFASNAKYSFYGFASAGILFNNLKFSDTRDSILHATVIDNTPFSSNETIVKPHIEVGIGAKFLLTNVIGMSLEGGLFYDHYRVGLFYNMKHKSRKNIDKYGW